jgi:DNA primase large subunit
MERLLYHDPPRREIEIEDLRAIALSRVEVLVRAAEFESKGLRGERLWNALAPIAKERNVGDWTSSRLERQDLASHYALRLAYCKSMDLMRWFTRHETLLLDYRYHALSKEQQQPLIQDWCTDRFKQKPTPATLLTASEPVYCVPFQQALSLVKRRAVHMDAGAALVPLSLMLEVVKQRFREKLWGSLVIAHKVCRVDVQ